MKSLTKISLNTAEDLECWDAGPDAWNDYARSHPDRNLNTAKKPWKLGLSNSATLILWRQGKAAWNEWVGRNPIADVDFGFQNYDHSNDKTNFSNVNFPEGVVDFDAAIFGKFGASFRGASFGKGIIIFAHANFGGGKVDFRGANFVGSRITFERASFGDGLVDFSDASFGDGNVSFRNASFGDGEIKFDGAKFGRGDVTMEGASFGEGTASFRNAVFGGIARFDQLNELENCRKFSFDGFSFERLFTFSHEGTMGAPLDLRRTRLAHSLVVHDIKCDYGKRQRSDWSSQLCNWIFAIPLAPNPSWNWNSTAIDREDSQRFRRLKELAASNHNHAKTLEFNAQEKRCRRGDKDLWFGEETLDLLYAFFSDYGRSILRPLAALAVCWGVFSIAYWCARISFDRFSATAFALVDGETRTGLTAVNYAASNLLSFIPSGRTARLQGEELLFGGIVPDWVVFAGALQSVLSVIFLFLLGLALRNMFRV